MAVASAATRSPVVDSPSHTLLTSIPNIIASAGTHGTMDPVSLDSENVKDTTGMTKHDQARQCRNLTWSCEWRTKFLKRAIAGTRKAAQRSSPKINIAG